MPDYKITPQFLKDLHECGCMPDVKKALEKHYPEVFEEKKPMWPEGYEEFGAFQWNYGLYFRDELAKYIDYSYGAQPGPEGYKRAGNARLGGHGAIRLPSWIKTKNFGASVQED